MTQDEYGEHVVGTYRHEDTQLAQRTDWFLIFHAILLEAYFEAATRVSPLALGVSLFGLTTAFLWLAIGARQRINHRQLYDSLKRQNIVGDDLARIHHAVAGFRNGPWYKSWARATPVFTVVVPLATTVLWGSIAVRTAGEGIRSRVVGAAACLVLSILLTAWLSRHPKQLPDEAFDKFRWPSAAEPRD